MNEKHIAGKLMSEGYEMAQGDINMLQGQTWVKEDDGQFYVLELLDLNNAGSEGQVLVTLRNTWFPNQMQIDRSRWLSVLSSYGIREYLPGIARQDKHDARLVLVCALADYGIADPVDGMSECVAIVDREVAQHLDEYEIFAPDATVQGYGWAALWRAIENVMYSMWYAPLHTLRGGIQ